MIDLQQTSFPLHNETDKIPALGFGTLIADFPAAVIATENAIKAGFRLFDCAERYLNEREVGQALRTALVSQDNIFVTTKLWITNHRPKRVQPVFEASPERLELEYLTL